MINLKIRSLLIADDDIDDIMLILLAIDTFSKDINISHVQDGKQLITFLTQEIKPELILLDINMPKINGVDCLKMIKDNKYCENIPIIMYSTSANEEVIEKCFQLGAARYIVKPYKFDQIVNFMKMVVCVDWTASKIVRKEDFILHHSQIASNVVVRK